MGTLSLTRPMMKSRIFIAFSIITFIGLLLSEGSVRAAENAEAAYLKEFAKENKNVTPPVFPKGRVPTLLDGCTILAKSYNYTIVPSGSILHHGVRAAVSVETSIPKDKKFIEAREFFKSCPNDVVLINGVSNGIGRVEISGSVPKDEVKTVIAVDENNAPAYKVDFK